MSNLIDAAVRGCLKYVNYVLIFFGVIKLQVGVNFFLLFAGLAITFATAIEKEGDDPLQWLRDSIPGEPGVDYPIFSAVEQTQFSCEGKVFGGKSFLKNLIYSLYSSLDLISKP